jgi:hypothetical protein
MPLALMRLSDPSASTSESPAASLSYSSYGRSRAALTRAATYEEPLFRGFLWGYLKDRDWPERRVALLFWVGHLYCMFRASVSFWFVVPLGSVILAYLAWRSRTIAATMTAHAFLNTLGDTVGHRRW